MAAIPSSMKNPVQSKINETEFSDLLTGVPLSIAGTFALIDKQTGLAIMCFSDRRSGTLVLASEHSAFVGRYFTEPNLRLLIPDLQDIADAQHQNTGKGGGTRLYRCLDQIVPTGWRFSDMSSPGDEPINKIRARYHSDDPHRWELKTCAHCGHLSGRAWIDLNPKTACPIHDESY